MITKLDKIYVLTTILFCIGGHSCFAQIVDLSPEYGDLPLDDKEREAIFPQAASADQTPLGRLKRLTKAISHFPGNATLLEKRAIAYADACDYKNALADINNALKNDGRDSYYWTRAQIEALNKEYDAAINDCEFAKRISATPYISDWLMSKFYSSMGLEDKSKASARDSLNRMYLRGTVNTSSSEYRESMQSLGITEFKPEQSKSQKEEVLSALSCLADLDAPPSKEKLLQILGINDNDVKRLHAQSEPFYVICGKEKTPWMNFSNQFVGKEPNPSCHLDLTVDPAMCSINSSELKSHFEDLQKVEGGGPELVFRTKGKKCDIAFLHYPKGFQSLVSVQFDWK